MKVILDRDEREKNSVRRLIDWTGERYVPWVELETPEIHYEHLHRYYFAAQFAAGKNVLDLASGEGYGCVILASKALQVVGVEFDEMAVKHSTRRYQLSNVEFLQGTITGVPIQGEEIFDVITCFEAIEHIEEHDKLMVEIRRLLKQDGLFILSSPNKSLYTDEANYHNPYHVKELYFDELRSLLTNNFNHVQFLGQKVFPVSSIWPLGERQVHSTEFSVRKSENEFLPARIQERLPLYFIAVASRAQLPDNTYFSNLTDISEELLSRLRQVAAEKDRALLALSIKFDEELYKVETLGSQLAEKDQSIQELESQTAAKELTIGSLSAQAAEQERTIKTLSVRVTEQARDLQLLFENKQQALRALSTEMATVGGRLNAILNSRAWRWVSRYGRAKEVCRRMFRRLLHGSVALTQNDGLRVGIDSEIPETLAVGKGTALLLAGWCYHPSKKISSLQILVNGVGYPVKAFRMAKRDLFEAHFPTLDPRGYSYRSGFWAIIPIRETERTTRITLEILARLRNGATCLEKIATMTLQPTVI